MSEQFTVVLCMMGLPFVILSHAIVLWIHVTYDGFSKYIYILHFQFSKSVREFSNCLIFYT